MKRPTSFPMPEIPASPRKRHLSEDERALWERVARQVKPLKELLDLRTKLSDLRGSLQGNDKLDEILLETVKNEDKMNKLKTEVEGGSNG